MFTSVSSKTEEEIHNFANKIESLQYKHVYQIKVQSLQCEDFLVKGLFLFLSMSLYSLLVIC